MRVEIDLETQQLRVLRGNDVIFVASVSSALRGVGSLPNSYRTPIGNFRIAEKIGQDCPIGTIFRARKPVGMWDPRQPCQDDLITTRILWLDGLDPENANTRSRYIYIHGTNHESSLGQNRSHGCIRLGNDAMLQLHELISVDTAVTILPPRSMQAPLIFFDCDSTLSSIEGIDELAHVRGEAVYQQVVKLTNAAMNGEIPLSDVFPRRMEIIRPNREHCAAIADLYLRTIVPGAAEVIATLKARGWRVVILSGGFAPLIQPLASHLGVDAVEAVPIEFDGSGDYLDFGRSYPTTRNGGKPEIIRDWQNACQPSVTVMVGDGVSDLETASVVDRFIGFGGVIERASVKQQSQHYIHAFSELLPMLDELAESR